MASSANTSTTTIRVNYDPSDAIQGMRSLKNSFNAIAGSAAVGVVISLLKDARKESQEYKLAVNQLTTSIGFYSKAIINQANALEKSKMVQADETLRAAARLSFYFKEEKEIQKLIPAVLDLARAKGMDLASAADMLAISFTRSENAEKKDTGTIRGLGIEYKKTGDQAKDLDAMIKAVTDKVGDQSQAVFDSLDGWDKLAFKIKNVKEEWGKYLFGVSKSQKDEMNISEKEILLKEARITLQKLENNNTGTYVFNKKKSIDAVKANIAAYEKEIKTYRDNEQALKDLAIERNKKGSGLSEEELKKREKEAKKIDEEYIKRIGIERDFNETMKQIRRDRLEFEQEIDDQAMQENADWLNEWIEQEGNVLDQDVDLWVEANIKKQESFDNTASEIINSASSLAGALQSLSDAQTNKEIRNLDRKKMSHKRYDKEVERIEAEADERNRSFARAQQVIILGETIMNLSKAIMKSHATLPFPFNWVEAGLIGATGGVQIAAINAQHFQRGFLGEASRGRAADNMNAMIGRNEAVVPGPQYAMHEDDVRAIVNNTANTAAGMRALRGGTVVHQYYGLSAEQVIAVQRDSERRKVTGRLI